MSRTRRSKTTTFLTSIATAFIAGAAMAGSPMPIYEEPVPYFPVEPEATWEGFYGGLLGSYHFGDLIETDPDPDVEAPFDAVTYGFMAGYNFQKDKVVYGGEIDVQFGSGTLEYPAVGAANVATDVDFDVDYLVDLRARVGHAMDKVLVYAAGGFTTAGLSVDGGDGVSATGWNAGAGVDVAVTDKVFVGGEYVYRDLAGEYDSGGNVDLNAHAFQARVGFRF